MDFEVIKYNSDTMADIAGGNEGVFDWSTFGFNIDIPMSGKHPYVYCLEQDGSNVFFGLSTGRASGTYAHINSGLCSGVYDMASEEFVADIQALGNPDLRLWYMEGVVYRSGYAFVNTYDTIAVFDVATKTLLDSITLYTDALESDIYPIYAMQVDASLNVFLDVVNSSVTEEAYNIIMSFDGPSLSVSRSATSDPTYSRVNSNAVYDFNYGTILATYRDNGNVIYLVRRSLGSGDTTVVNTEQVYSGGSNFNSENLLMDDDIVFVSTSTDLRAYELTDTGMTLLHTIGESQAEMTKIEGSLVLLGSSQKIYTYSKSSGFDLVHTSDSGANAVKRSYNTRYSRTAVYLNDLLYLTDDEFKIYQPVPVSVFSTSASDLEVAFTDASVGVGGDSIASWEWDFGDGQSSTQQNPVHTYAESDTYSIVLTVTTVKGRSNSSTQSLSLPLPSVTIVPEFSVSETIGPVNDPVILTDQTGNEDLISEYEWELSDGRVFNGQNPGPISLINPLGPNYVTLTIKTEDDSEFKKQKVLTYFPEDYGVDPDNAVDISNNVAYTSDWSGSSVACFRFYAKRNFSYRIAIETDQTNPNLATDDTVAYIFLPSNTVYTSSNPDFYNDDDDKGDFTFLEDSPYAYNLEYGSRVEFTATETGWYMLVITEYGVGFDFTP